MTRELSDDERLVLARENAADRACRWQDERQWFYDGWDAAMVYVEAERIRSCGTGMEVNLSEQVKLERASKSD